MPLILAAGLLAAATGCVGVSIGGRREPPPVPIVVQASPLSPADPATLAEIDAAARLNFDNLRLESLSQIARRPTLNPTAQVHLVNVAYRCLGFDNHKVALLKTIIANRGFNDATRQAIVIQLHKISFDNHRQEILNAINKRMTPVE
jgi:hypothetical protein